MARIFREVTGLVGVTCEFNCLQARRDFYAELEMPKAQSLIVHGPCDLDSRRAISATRPYYRPSPKKVVVG